MSTTDEQRLRDALTAAIEPLKMYRAYGWPDRNRVIEHCESALAQQAPTPAVPEPPSVHQALLDSLSALLDEQRELPTNKRISLDYRESIEAAINKLAKLPRIKS